MQSGCSVIDEGKGLGTLYNPKNAHRSSMIRDSCFV